MELRIASDRDLVNCYKSLQKLNEDCKKLRAQLKELEEVALLIARLLTQKVHSAPITQQAGKLASHAQRANDVPVNFS
jgi:hypothetical protein